MAACERCGAAYHQDVKARRFCSVACANKAKPHPKRKPGRVAYIPKRKRTDRWARVAVPCAWCGMMLDLGKSDAARSVLHFCRDGTRATSCIRAWQSASRTGRRIHRVPPFGSGRGIGGFIPELGHYVRSTWEANVARWLLAEGIRYIYEPQTFTFDGFSYIPDFYLPGFGVYIEVKGRWFAKARMKFEAFRERYPNIIVIGPEEYALLGFDPNDTRAGRKAWLKRQQQRAQSAPASSSSA